MPRSAAKICEFHDTDMEVEQQIIVGGRSSYIRKKALRDTTYSVKDMLVDGRGKEASTYQSNDIEGFKEEFLERVSIKSRLDVKKSCFNCGGSFPHS